VSPLVFKLHACGSGRRNKSILKNSYCLDQRTNYKENKMNPFKRNFVLSLLLLFITAFSMVAKALRVDIYNDLGQGTITVHCFTLADVWFPSIALSEGLWVRL
jgi:hypothetical protein